MAASPIPRPAQAILRARCCLCRENLPSIATAAAVGGYGLAHTACLDRAVQAFARPADPRAAQAKPATRS